MAHLQTGTSSTSQSSGSSYPLILDHVLSYPGTYEIPLRTMYTLNSAPRAQPLPQNFKQATASRNSDGDSLSNSQQDATAQFTSSLLSQISHLPSQPCSLPPSFINSFVRRCFTAELEAVDFPQALTALDYLKDLEHRRRRESTNAFRRLGLDPANLDDELEKVAHEYPGVTSWVRSIKDKEKKVEALYTQIYIGLRRWVSHQPLPLFSPQSITSTTNHPPQILINELQLPPYNKSNCVAMLNTLYPPVITSQPTTQLTPTVLTQQRDGWFRYITAVETNGAVVLANLTNQGRRPGEENGWPALRASLDMYLRTATVVIAECSDVPSSRQQFSSGPQGSLAAVAAAAASVEDGGGKKRGRKADSGVSFGGASSAGGGAGAGGNGGIAEYTRPSTSGTSASARSKHSVEAPYVSSTPTPTPVVTMSASSKAGSALERLARELLRMKPKKTATAAAVGGSSSSAAATVPVAAVDDSAVASKKHATLRKMRSLGALGEARQKLAAKEEQEARPAVPKVDREVMKREMERLRREREGEGGFAG
ncbi:MAG: hypothetical protein Q9165_007528 [Trypethelium subeluteriae]